MEKETWELLLKVLSASLLMAVTIKYGASGLPLPPTPISALILILSPTLAMVVIFAARGFP